MSARDSESEVVMQMKMKKSIGKRLLIGLIVFTLLMAGSICLFVSRLFENRTIAKYEYAGSALTNSLAELIDGEKAVSYLETGEQDDYYDQIQRLIVSLKNQFNPLSIYVCVPEDHRLLFIWSDEVDEEDTIGYVEEYPADKWDWIQNKMQGTNQRPLWYVTDPVYGRLAIASAPLPDSTGKPVAMVFADFSMPEIEKTVLFLTLHISLYVAILMAAFIAVYYWYVSRNLVRPIRRLTAAADQMAENLEGDTVYRSDIHTDNELETLSKAFEKMDTDLRSYIADNLRISAERQRLTAGLELAASIQNGQLPQKFPAFPDRKEFDVFAVMTPAKTVGGDFYDFFLVDEGHLALVIADVSGKGVPAALFMMISRILLKNRLQAGESPARALAGANRQLEENNQAQLFVTIWTAVVDLATGHTIEANAGHEHPALCHRGGFYELVRYRHSMAVGVLPQTRFTEREYTLLPGDSLFVYTDGVTEATNSQEELFGTDRMLEFLNQDPGAGCRETLEHVTEGIRDFVGPAEQFDDITMLCFRYHGQPAQANPSGSALEKTSEG